MRKALVDLLLSEAERDPKFVFMTGDLGFNVVEPLQSALGPRFVNAGIAEQNMMTMAGSLAQLGLRPYVYSIAPFVTARCFEQIRNDIVYPGHRVAIVGAGAGFSYGNLGPTHHSLDDCALLASLPNLAILSPANAAELEAVHDIAIASRGPFYLRIPREDGKSFPAPKFGSFETGAHVVRPGRDVAICASGPMLTVVLDAAARLADLGIDARIVSIPVVVPFPAPAVKTLIGDVPVVGVFEGYDGGPFELGMRRVVMARGLPAGYLDISVPRAFPKSVARTDQLRVWAGIDCASIVQCVQEHCAVLGINRDLERSLEARR